MITKLKYPLLIFILSFFGCKKTENYSEVRKTLEQLLVDDQKFRTPVFDLTKQAPLDRKNTKIVSKIIDSLGWLGENKVGHDANLAMFLAIQHADKLETMEKYLPIIKKASEKGNADKKQVAYLIDRVELLNNRKQIYGTQLSFRANGKAFIENLQDSSNVNTRRKSMNLISLEDYLKKVDSSDNK
jgi:hypothetical protein